MKSPQETLKNFIGNHSNYEKLEYFNKNISSIISSIKESNGKIAIVSDFDYTLTKRYDFQDSQVNFFSTYCVLENHKDVSENFRTKFKQLFETYRKYPVDLSIEFETRKNMVMKWYQENLELILEEGLTKAHFEEMIDQSHGKFFFRNGILELFEMVLNYKIPFFIISGGIYEIIEHALKTVIPFYNQLEEEKLINIIANRFTYDESSEKMIGYYQPVVYHFNKGEMMKAKLENRSAIENIIVLGDHINDTDSIRDLNLKNSIKIGFLNSVNLINQPKDHYLYEAFSQTFDLAIMNDGTLNLVNKIIYDIISHT